jgi:hypothetical protein
MSQADLTIINICEVRIIVPQTVGHTKLELHEIVLFIFLFQKMKKNSMSGANTSRNVVSFKTQQFNTKQQ